MDLLQIRGSAGADSSYSLSRPSFLCKVSVSKRRNPPFLEAGFFVQVLLLDLEIRHGFNTGKRIKAVTRRLLISPPYWAMCGFLHHCYCTSFFMFYNKFFVCQCFFVLWRSHEVFVPPIF